MNLKTADPTYTVTVYNRWRHYNTFGRTCIRFHGIGRGKNKIV